MSTGAGEGHLPCACEHYAGDTKKLEKTLAHRFAGPFSYDITIDFEDGAPVGQEAEAAQALVACLAASLKEWPSASSQPPGVGFRVHPPDHPSFQDDLRLLAQALALDLAYLTIPKVGDLASAKAAIAHLAQTFPPKNAGHRRCSSLSRPMRPCETCSTLRPCPRSVTSPLGRWISRVPTE
ncbi:MAG TPA: hypothetical protein VLA31_00230, partial [Burkholderiaceae bacterium]|nr:hypothetical protein [Burkholderiaceae bacterium]